MRKYDATDRIVIHINGSSGSGKSKIAQSIIDGNPDIVFVRCDFDDCNEERFIDKNLIVTSQRHLLTEVSPEVIQIALMHKQGFSFGVIGKKVWPSLPTSTSKHRAYRIVKKGFSQYPTLFKK